MLFDLISGLFSGQKISFFELIIGLLSSIFVIFVTMPIHEWAHAFVAYRLGDRTAKYYGRLTLNPFAHIDWTGAVLVMLFGFGFAKPVPVDQRNFKKPKLGMALVGLAGPLANFLTAFVCILLQATFSLLATMQSSVALGYVAFFFFWAGQINLYLAAFNLIPLPPMDGSRILFAVLPDRIYYRIQSYERYIYLIVLFCAAFGLLSKPTAYIANGLSLVCTNMVYRIFSLFL